VTDAQAKRRIARLVRKWVRVFGLTNWDITVELAPDLADADEGITCIADCMAHWQYEAATLRFLQSQVERATERTLENDVIHELLHCVLSELETRGRQAKHEERTVVNLARAFQRVAA